MTKFGDTVPVSKWEAYRGILFFIVYTTLLLGTVWILSNQNAAEAEKPQPKPQQSEQSIFESTIFRR